MSAGRDRGLRLWRALSGLLAAALSIGACEPLDLALFPDRTDGDAGVSGDPGSVLLAAPEAGPPDAAAAAPDATSERDPCFPGATACEACIQAGSCPAGRVCHPRTGVCLLPCAEDPAACPAPSVCSPLGVCVSCFENRHCPGASAQVCDTERGVCVECVTSDDCTAEPLERPTCLPGLQRCGCDSNDDCPVGFCETLEGHCEDDD
jgi:hypothetical protein